ncbi:MAG TPA: helicase C-terminal domain-containing protein, partial [Deltaproteobacteria bacterium]|nr:helicase C-terminal domain-containing protein [Deltaproteobacteria bacterium]
LAMATSIKTQELTEQIYYEVREQDKFEALCRIIDLAPDFYGLVFCRTRAETADIAERLGSRGYKADGIHGEIGQDQREQIMRRFRSKAITILVATDVAARGIDVNHLSHVVNFDLPQDPDAYTHRIGRTGRAGRKGIAVSLVESRELRMLDHIRQACGAHLRKARIPSVAELIAAKHAHLKATITQVSQEQDCAPYHLLAQELLDTGEALDVLAACLRHAFGGELDQGAYAEIASPASAGAVLPLTRLRVARGRKHGLNPHKLVRLIREQTGVKEKLVRDIEVLNDCTFISVPKAEAAVIQKRLRSKDGQPLSSKAWPKKAA